MDRGAFGRWGAELSEGRFACALAALGVIGTRGWGWMDTAFQSSGEIAEQMAWVITTRAPVSWSVPPDPPEVWLEERVRTGAASAFADGWIELSTRADSVRFELSGAGWHRLESPTLASWYAQRLAHPEVNARSVYVRVDEPSAEVGWQWPLRVGFLRDERSRTLRARLEQDGREHDWLRPLTTFVDVEGVDGVCDVLLLPTDLRGSLAAVAALPTPPVADCIVVLGHTHGSAEQWTGLIAGLRAAARTSGIAVARLTGRDEVRWYRELMRELSHAHPLDVALFTAARHEKVGAPAPHVWASGRLMEVATLAHQLRRMAARFRDPQLASQPINLSAAPATKRIFTSGYGKPHSFGELAYRLDELAEFAQWHPGFKQFQHESGMATSAAELASAAAELSTTAAGPAEPRDSRESAAAPRSIQARVFDVSSREEGIPRRRSLRAGAVHEIRVRIGRPSEEWGLRPRMPSFPDEALPRGADYHELTVIFVEPRLLAEAQSATITLPRTADSTEAHFWIFAPEDAERLDARILVVHRNRVLQTALLRGPITADEDRGDLLIEPESEVVTRAALDDLAWRRPFDAALVANHDGAGISGVTAVADGEARSFRVGDEMRKVLAEFDDALSKVATRKSKFEDGLAGVATADLLRDFAALGSLLHDHIVKDGLRNSGLSKGERLQVISARADARLPVEFVYDRAAPAADARLCPNAKASLRRGACDDSCPRGGDAERSIVCPLAFWGLSRVIERHAHDEDLVERVVGTKDFAFHAEPTSRRRTLDLLRGGMVGGSHRVTDSVADGLTRICERISAVVHQTITPVPDWKAWKTNASQGHASLLVLIVHTEMMPNSNILARMELGENSWLSVAELNKEYLGTDRGAKPLVILLGCETGAPEVQFASFVAKCRHAEAPIVVVAGSKIHSVHAVPVAEEFVDALCAAVKQENVTFGEVMRTVRREMLADGFPMVLALTAYGDADWRLATDPGETP